MKRRPIHWAPPREFAVRPRGRGPFILPALAAMLSVVLSGQVLAARMPIDVYPGAPIKLVATNLFPAGLLTSVCTLNFLFSGSDGARYVGTAGHCVVPLGTERTWPAGNGLSALTPAQRRIGAYVYAVQDDPRVVSGTSLGPTPPVLDFALIRLDPNVAASPQVVHFGGPTGMFAAPTSGPLLLAMYGNGVQAAKARRMVSLGVDDPYTFGAIGYIYPGDSGGPVITADGAAIGFATALGHYEADHNSGAVSEGDVEIERLSAVLQRAERALKLRLRLLTAPIRSSL